jgi:hypothetical protein
LDWLDDIGRAGSLEQAFDYFLAVLNAPSYTARFWKALEVDELRVPLTTDSSLFDRLASLGAKSRSSWMASRESRSGISWTGAGSMPLGIATWDDETIHFANERRIEGVRKDAWDFQVSGYRVLQKWFSARQHWTLTVANSLQALSTVIAVLDLVDLGPALDQGLQELIE